MGTVAVHVHQKSPASSGILQLLDAKEVVVRESQVNSDSLVQFLMCYREPTGWNSFSMKTVMGNGTLEIISGKFNQKPSSIIPKPSWWGPTGTWIWNGNIKYSGKNQKLISCTKQWFMFMHLNNLFRAIFKNQKTKFDFIKWFLYSKAKLPDSFLASVVWHCSSQVAKLAALCGTIFQISPTTKSFQVDLCMHHPDHFISLMRSRTKA